MKALEKDRNRRYETANGLAMDLERYLADEPVEARPSSASYRLRKFLKRNKGPVLAASIVLLALVGGIIGTTLGMIHADNRRIEADQARAAEAEQRTKAEKARDRTRQALDAMTSSFTEDSLSTQTAISDEQKRFLSEVLSYYQEFAGEKAGDEQSRARTAQAAERVGTIEYRLGRETEAVPAFRLARDGYKKLVADFPAVPRYRQELESSHNNLGLLLAGLGKGPQAEQSHRQALTIGESLAAELPRRARVPPGTGQEPQRPGAFAGPLGQRPGGGAGSSPGAGHRGKAGRGVPRRARIPPRTGREPRRSGVCAHQRGQASWRRSSIIARPWPSGTSSPPTSPPCRSIKSIRSRSNCVIAQCAPCRDSPPVR